MIKKLLYNLMIISSIQCALITVPNRGSFSKHPEDLKISNSITIKYSNKVIKCYDAHQHSLRTSSLFLLQPYWWFPPLSFMFLFNDEDGPRFCEDK